MYEYLERTNTSFSTGPYFLSLIFYRVKRKIVKTNPHTFNTFTIRITSYCFLRSNALALRAESCRFNLISINILQHRVVSRYIDLNYLFFPPFTISFDHFVCRGNVLDLTILQLVNANYVKKISSVYLFIQKSLIEYSFNILSLLPVLLPRLLFLRGISLMQR